MKLLSSIMTFWLLLAVSTLWAEKNDNQYLDDYTRQVKENRDKFLAEKQSADKTEPAVQTLIKSEDEAKPMKHENSEYIVVPFELSFLPVISTSGFLGYKTIDILALNIIAGYAAKLHGVEVGMINIIGEEVKGVQTASVLNYSGGDTFGLQTAGVANFSFGKLEGIQTGGVFNYADSAQGGQFGTINFCANDTWIQAGVINITGSFHALQAGVINISKGKSEGLQIGVINYSEDIDGVPVGVISIVRNGVIRGAVWYDETGFVNIGLKHGSKSVYNIYAAGIDTSYQYFKATLGLGFHIPVESFFINIDGTSSVITRVSDCNGAGLLSAVRLGFGIQLAEHLALIAGVSFNYYENFNTGLAIQPIHKYEFSSGDTENHRFWPGFYAGIEF